MELNNHQIIVVFTLILLNSAFGFGFSLSSNCTETYYTNGNLIYNSSDSNETWIVYCIVGPVGTHVSLLLFVRDVSIDNTSSLAIGEMTGNFTDILVIANGTDLIGGGSINVNSITNGVVVTLSRDENDSMQESRFSIPFQIESDANSTTIYTSPSGRIVSNGGADKGLNYVHTFLINLTKEYHINLYLEDFVLNDGSGDFLVIGSGNDVLSGSPSVLMTGIRKVYPVVVVENNTAYLHVFAKNYSAQWRFSFYYNSSVFVPATDEPPTTEAPPIPLNATISFDIKKDNFMSVVTRFSQTIEQFAASYCRGEFFDNGTVSNVTLNVTVVEAAITDPCLVLVFYVSLDGYDTCIGHRPFLVQDFDYLMSHYGSQIGDQFGRSIMSSCGMDVTVWVVVIAIILCISLTLTIIVAMTNRNDSYRKLAKPKDGIENVTVTVNEIFGMTLQDSEEQPCRNMNASLKHPASFINAKHLQYPKEKDSKLHHSCYNNFGFLSDELVSKSKSDEEIYFDRRSMTTKRMCFAIGDEIVTRATLPRRGISFAAAVGVASYPRRLPKRMVSYPPTHSFENENHIYDEVDIMSIPENTLNDTKL